jgi:hypothetical protein
MLECVINVARALSCYTSLLHLALSYLGANGFEYTPHKTHTRLVIKVLYALEPAYQNLNTPTLIIPNPGDIYYPAKLPERRKRIDFA